MTGRETTTAIANYCGPNGTETNYIVRIHMNNGHAKDITQSLETTCYWQVRQNTSRIAFDAHTFPCARILRMFSLIAIRIISISYVYYIYHVYIYMLTYNIYI